MQDTLRLRLQGLSERILDVTEGVQRVLDAEEPSGSEISDCHDRVEGIVQEYAKLLATIPAAEREAVERLQGRKVVDLRRHAGALPARARGQSTRRADDVPPEGGWPLFTRREPGRSLTEFAPPKRGDPVGPRVGTPIESWCSRCDGLREHTIVAMVGGQPKQVICGSCQARHAYRTGPARSAATSARTVNAALRTPTGGDPEAEKRRTARAVLQKELAAATEVRPFSKRERYRPGQILEHPEHGRGKIENVLRSSLLVRFPSGLKSVSLL